MIDQQKRLIRRIALLGLIWILYMGEPLEAYETLFQMNANRFGIPKELLVAIAVTESDLLPLALNVDGRSYYPKDAAEAARILRRNKGRRINVGLMQIDDLWFRHLKLDPLMGLNPDRNITLGAEILRENIQRHGANWRAVAAYNGSSKTVKGRRYCEKVARNLKKILTQSHGSEQVASVLGKYSGKDLISAVLGKSISCQTAFAPIFMASHSQLTFSLDRSPVRLDLPPVDGFEAKSFFQVAWER